MRVVSLLGLVFPASALAFQVPMPRPELCSHASLVVVGEVTGAQGQWSAGPAGGIETLADVAVERTLSGRAPASLTVTTPGGHVGDLWLTVEDAASFRTDQRYLLLLTERDGAWRVVGGSAGIIPLKRTANGAGEDEAAAIASLGACLAR